jgi:hypothetical protein
LIPFFNNKISSENFWLVGGPEEGRISSHFNTLFSFGGNLLPVLKAIFFFFFPPAFSEVFYNFCPIDAKSCLG